MVEQTGRIWRGRRVSTSIFGEGPRKMGGDAILGMSAMENVPGRRVRVCYFNTWAGPLEEVDVYMKRRAAVDLRPLVAKPEDEALMKKARLDFDWYAENARCFGAMTHPGIVFLPAWIAGTGAVLELARAPRAEGEERWLIFMGHQPQALKAAAGGVFSLLARAGVRILYYAFDEASRRMACFNDIAPHLSVLIHDEEPLAVAGRARLSVACRTIHRSWVANLVPFSVPFREAPAPEIIFLGSQLGLTPHRERQIRFLRETFPGQFVASSDHSIAVAGRAELNRYQVAFCPEGRMFATAAMAATHTDRPFWSGCLGIVPVSEDAATGGRLPELAAGRYMEHYPHGDLAELAAACRRALAWTVAERRRMYDYYNRHETVGTVVAEAIAAAAPVG